MTSSLTQQNQLSFNPARFLPIDLSQPIYGGFYPTVSNHPTTANFNHFVQSTFFCKDLQDVYGAGSDPKLLPDLSSGKKATDYGLLSDSDSCSNSSSGSHHLPSSSSPNGGKSTIGGGEKKRKELVRDEAYFERRKKNNDAAKRSRDSRKKKEDEVAMRAALLEQENLRLRFEVERLKTEIDRHRIVALNPKVIPDIPTGTSSISVSTQPPPSTAAAIVAAAVGFSNASVISGPTTS